MMATRSSRVRALDGLRVIVGALTHSARAVEQHTGVTNAQLFLLQQIAGSAGLSVNDLAARARTQQSTVSIVIGRLVRAGYVRKGRDTADGRRVVRTRRRPTSRAWSARQHGPRERDDRGAGAGQRPPRDPGPPG